MTDPVFWLNPATRRYEPFQPATYRDLVAGKAKLAADEHAKKVSDNTKRIADKRRQKERDDKEKAKASAKAAREKERAKKAAAKAKEAEKKAKKKA